FGVEAGEQLFIIDVSASNRSGAVANDRLAKRIEGLAREGQGDVRVAFVNGELVRSYLFDRDDQIHFENPPKRDEGDPSSFDAALALTDTSLERVFVFTDGDIELASALPRVDAKKIALVDSAIRQSDFVRIAGFRAPATIRQGEGVRIDVDYAAASETPVTLTLRSDSLQGVEETQSLHAGPLTRSASFTLQAEAIPAGTRFLDLQVEIAPVGLAAPLEARDDLESNNQVRIDVEVIGQNKVLVLVPSERELDGLENQALPALLGKGDVHTEFVHVAEITFERLAGIDALIIDDVGASEIEPIVETLHKAVSQMGLKLIVSGARNAWGPGGYQGTAFEYMLPLDANPNASDRRFHAVMVDTSQSMGELLNGVEKIDWLRQAAQAYLEGLDEEDSF
ncbi:MAG: hypothetical protein KDB07_09575, partial [Planctomycetes bacterium]|nr:hypothetical protein [Planctomycetota bacterium]